MSLSSATRRGRLRWSKACHWARLPLAAGITNSWSVSTSHPCSNGSVSGFIELRFKVVKLELRREADSLANGIHLEVCSS